MTANLLSRLEGLTAPDREVDALIMGACFEWAKPEPPYLAPHCVGDQPIYWHAPEPYYKRPVPELTASLDATVALCKRVLPGWSWECRASGTGDKGQATVWNPSKAPGYNEEQRAYNCATPAIALLIAILTALEARENG